MEQTFTDQAALSFLTQQAAHVESQVYKIKYEDIQYPELVDIDTSAGDWAKSIEFYSMDQSGKAAWFDHKGDDVPLVNTSLQQHSHKIEMAAVGYGYTNQELGYAQRLGMSIETDRAAAVRRAYEEFVDDLVLDGSAEKGMDSLLSNPAVTVAPAVTGDWGTATPIQILADINSALTAVYAGTKRVEMSNTVLLPVDKFTQIATQPMSADSNMTVLDWLLRGNVYTATTGQQLTIKAVGRLETAGAADATRMVVYRKSPEVAKLHLPVPLRFLEAMRKGPMSYQVPAYFRVGGVEVRLPKAMRYVDGI